MTEEEYLEYAEDMKSWEMKDLERELIFLKKDLDRDYLDKTTYKRSIEIVQREIDSRSVADAYDRAMSIL